MPGPGTAATTSAASRNSGKLMPFTGAVRSMRPRQTERHDLLKRGLHRRSGEERQRVDGHCAVMLGAADRVFQRAVLGHQADGMVEVAIPDFATLQCLDPELALAVIAAAEGQHHGQRDLALAEIVADVLAELC